MKTLKKISANEFRLHAKKFLIDYSPLNYFEKFRINILFSRLLFWFFRKYGLYLYCYRLRLLSAKFFFQFFYYRTYYHLRHRKLWSTRKLIWSTVGFRYKKKKVKRQRQRRFHFFLVHNLYRFWGFDFFRKHRVSGLKNFRYFKKQSYRRGKRSLLENQRNVLTNIDPLAAVRAGIRRKVSSIKFYRNKRDILFFQAWQKRKYFFHLFANYKKKLQVEKQKYARRLKKRLYFNFFFIYFFLYFFQYRSVVLYKSMYKYLLVNKIFIFEHRLLLRRLKYIKQYDWSFDFLFLFHYAVNLSNFDFVLPYFIYYLKRSYKQRPFLNILFNLLRTLYYLKTNIRGVRVIVHGPYDRHGRSRSLLFKIGDLAVTNYTSFILYDIIQWPTFYGATHVKLWIEYKVPPFSK